MKLTNAYQQSTFPQTCLVRKPCRATPLFAHHRFRRKLPCEKLRRQSTGKELDRETGLYYFGARYLDPRTSRWLSPDPAIWEGDFLPSAPINDEARERNENLPGMGGVFYTVNLNVFAYGGNNPIRYVDPDGRAPKPWKQFNDMGMGGGAGGGGGGRVSIGRSVGGRSALELHIARTTTPPSTRAPRGNTQQAPNVRSSPLTSRTFQTYTKTNTETGQVYSGRTSGFGTPAENIARRDSSHHLRPEDGWGPAILDRTSTNPNAIRGREQQLIDRHGGAQSMGGTSGNRINSISPHNPNINLYLQAAQELR